MKYDTSVLTEKDLPAKQEIAQGQADEPLIKKGILQAEILAHNLKIDRIYCGDQIRCKQTAEIVAKITGIPVIIADKRISARNYGKISDKAMETDKLKHFWRYPKKIENLETIACYAFAPEKIGVEKSSDFEKKVLEFIQDDKIIMENTLIIAGSDVRDYIKDNNFYFAYNGEKDYELPRGKLMHVDFARIKEQPKSLLRKVLGKKTLDEEIERI